MRDAVLLNAAAALAALEPTAVPVAQRLEAAMQPAAVAVDSGAAQAALAGWVETSQALAAAEG